MYLLLFILVNTAQVFAQHHGQVVAGSLQTNLLQVQKDTIKANFTNKRSVKGKPDAAWNINTAALAYSIQSKDTLGEVWAYNHLGDIASAKSDFIAAADYYYKSLKLGEAKKDYAIIGKAYVRLSALYETQENYLKSLDFAKQSLASYELVNDEKEYAYPLYWISCSFLNLGKFDSGFYYANKSLFLAQKYNNKINEALALFTISEYYESQSDNYNAIKYALDSKKIWDEYDSSNEDAIYNEGCLGIYYLQLAKKQETGKVPTSFQNLSKSKLLSIATGYLETAIRKSSLNGNKDFQSEFQLYLAEIDAINGKYKEAYFNYKNHAEIKDSIFTQENKNKIAALENQRAIDFKNQEIENEELQINSQRKQRVFFISGLLLLGIIGALIYWQSLARKKTNTALIRLNNELDEANRSPIANLINFMQLQKRQPNLLSVAQKQDGEQKITNAAEALLNTMEAMLLWSKGQMENFKPDIQTVAVKKLFDYLDRLFSQHENIQFAYTNPQNLTVLTDENYLQTIMYNLTSNAVKALANTSGATIEWKAFLQAGKTVLSISDNGPGLPPEVIHILSQETQVANAKTGLGLHLIRDLAKAIQYTITAESAPEKGACFYLVSTVE
jgi:signal transduction histidine kinase